MDLVKSHDQNQKVEQSTTYSSVHNGQEKKGHYQKVMYLTGERDETLPCRFYLTKKYEGCE